MDNEQDGNRYGFKFNLHQKSSDLPFSNKYLDKLNSNNTTTAKRVLIGLVALLAVGAFDIFYLTNNLVRASYMLIPVALISIGILIVLYQYVFIDRSSGALLLTGWYLTSHLYNSFLVSRGKKKKFRNIGINSIDPNGLIHFNEHSGRDVGYLYIIEGAVSPTAFPSEVRLQESLSMNYQTSRNETSTNFLYTSSELQNASVQMYNMKKTQLAASDGLKLLVNQQMNYTSEYIDGKQPTVIQHQMIKDISLNGLNNSESLFEKYVNSGMFYSARRLNGHEVERFYDDMYGLK